MFRKNNWFLARLPGTSANSKENYGCQTSQAFAKISGNIKTPESIQRYRKVMFCWSGPNLQ